MTWIRTKINHIEVTQSIAIIFFIKERNKKRKSQIYVKVKVWIEVRICIAVYKFCGKSVSNVLSYMYVRSKTFVPVLSHS